MMAARGGAAKVTSVEVVPAIAAVARQIVAANGYGDVVTIHNVRSDELPLELMGRRADILVSELIDDHLIGARCSNRSMFALPSRLLHVSLRPPHLLHR